MQQGEPAGTKDQTEELKAKAEELDAKANALKARIREIEAEAEKIRAKAEGIKARAEEIKARIAGKVRSDSQEHSLLTPEEAIVDLDDDVSSPTTTLGDLLTEMADDDRYRDIKTITTTNGLVFVYSDTYIKADDAAAKSLVEEVKFVLANAIRADSRDQVNLTPAQALYELAPETDRAIIDILLKGIQSEERFADIKTVAASNSDVYFHSDKYLVGSYAVTLLLAMAGDHCATIAETVRDESRIYPRTTRVASFFEPVYGVPSESLSVVINDMLQKPEYADIKRIVHPATGAVHLYSNQFITEDRALAMMDWEEVGRANNP